MRSGFLLRAALAAALALPAGANAAAADPASSAADPTAAPARHASAPLHPNRHAARRVARRGRGYGRYGFLPGYRPPEQIEWEDRVAAWRRGPQWWYGPPRFYHGRWNGGGFGPCWTQTPIGNVWNCGH